MRYLGEIPIAFSVGFLGLPAVWTRRLRVWMQIANMKSLHANKDYESWRC